MELKDTIQGMISADYKERFKAEYFQLKTRYEKLKKIVNHYRNGTLTFTPSCPLDNLEHQLHYMSGYLWVLEDRAYYEGVDLEKP